MRKLVGMVVLLAALCAVIYIGNHRAIFAIGEGIVILSGGIDLSVGSVIAFAGVFVAYAVSEQGMAPAAAVALALVFGVVVGLWHGFLVTRVRLQPFIATLCTMLILRGHARVLVDEQTMGFGNQFLGLRALGDGFVFGIPTPVVILVGVALIASFFMHFTVYGRYLYAIGRNAQAAAYSGVKVGRMQTAAYVACGGLAALAGVLYATYTNSVQPATTGLAYELYAIAGAVLGGCSLRGGEGTIVGIIVGAAIMRVMANGINLLGIAPAWEFAVVGYVILVGVIADSLYRQRAARRGGPRSKPETETPG